MAQARPLPIASGRFDRFLAGIRRNSRKPQLNFLHLELPHVPWQYLPSGQSYPVSGPEIPGLEATVGQRAVAAGSGLQRYLLQVGFVDRLLGRLTQRLRAQALRPGADRGHRRPRRQLPRRGEPAGREQRELRRDRQRAAVREGPAPAHGPGRRAARPHDRHPPHRRRHRSACACTTGSTAARSRVTAPPADRSGSSRTAAARSGCRSRTSSAAATPRCSDGSASSAPRTASPECSPPGPTEICSAERPDQIAAGTAPLPGRVRLPARVLIVRPDAPEIPAFVTGRLTGTPAPANRWPSPSTAASPRSPRAIAT